MTTDSREAVAMPVVEIKLDAPDEIRFRRYERITDGHAFKVEWPPPAEAPATNVSVASWHRFAEVTRPM